ncbi:sulfotransferase family 2 domain-containing protein [Aestuariibius sp. 2305UL40-4]|uniref:sulfotransferase family 2 domain-containing protein n=1 Tax=Aestuariibius violaceus TaxID=3234132 RepID=UPI00345EACB7
MILSRKRRYIFVHIPKTGGTSMALALEERAAADDILVGDTPKARRRKKRLKGVKTRGRLWKHSTLAEAEGLLTPDDLDRSLIFTLVRNPWDRMVSYYHWLRAQDFPHPAVPLAKSTDFAGFVTAPQTRNALRIPAAHYMRDSTGTDRADLYIRLENLAEDIPPLNAHLGFSLTLPRSNASDRPRDYRTAYTDQTAALIADLCAEDIARFGYRFEDGPAAS